MPSKTLFNARAIGRLIGGRVDGSELIRSRYSFGVFNTLSRVGLAVAAGAASVVAAGVEAGSTFPLVTALIIALEFRKKKLIPNERNKNKINTHQYRARKLFCFVSSPLS